MLNLVPITAIFLVIAIAFTRYVSSYHFSGKEIVLHFVVQMSLSIIIAHAIQQHNINDRYVIGGYVVSKTKEKVPCEHDYEICTGSGENQTCVTYYDHSYDWDWNVYSNISKRPVTISRIDNRGSKEPPRWSSITKGDSFATTAVFENYIGRTSDITNNTVQRNMQLSVPSYPNPQIYDYYKTNRVFTNKITINHNEWNTKLGKAHQNLPKNKRANVMFVFTNNPDPAYRYSVESAWKGGKLNDVIVIVGAPKFPQIEWVDVVMYARNKGNELSTILIQDNVMKHGMVDTQLIPIVVDVVKTKFDLIDTTQFEYLKSSIKMTTMQIIGFIVMMIVIYCLLLYIFLRYDL